MIIFLIDYSFFFNFGKLENYFGIWAKNLFDAGSRTTFYMFRFLQKSKYFQQDVLKKQFLKRDRKKALYLKRKQCNDRWWFSPFSQISILTLIRKNSVLINVDSRSDYFMQILLHLLGGRRVNWTIERHGVALWDINHSERYSELQDFAIWNNKDFHSKCIWVFVDTMALMLPQIVKQCDVYTVWTTVDGLGTGN